MPKAGRVGFAMFSTAFASAWPSRLGATRTCPVPLRLVDEERNPRTRVAAPKPAGLLAALLAGLPSRPPAPSRPRAKHKVGNKNPARAALAPAPPRRRRRAPSRAGWPGLPAWGQCRLGIGAVRPRVGVEPCPTQPSSARASDSRPPHACASAAVAMRAARGFRAH